MLCSSGGCGNVIVTRCCVASGKLWNSCLSSIPGTCQLLCTAKCTWPAPAVLCSRVAILGEWTPRTRSGSFVIIAPWSPESVAPKIEIRPHPHLYSRIREHVSKGKAFFVRAVYPLTWWLWYSSHEWIWIFTLLLGFFVLLVNWKRLLDEYFCLFLDMMCEFIW